MKRLTVAFAAIGISTTLFAALPAATDPTLVEVPLLPGGFVIGATGYYLQPSDSHGDLDYAISGAFFSSGAISGFRFYNIDPDYDWAWGVNVGYIFPGTGNDINLSYLHFDSNDSAHLAAAGFQGILSDTVSNVPFIAPTAGLNTALAMEESLIVLGFPIVINPNTTTITAKSDYDLNQVDLTFGQYINVGCRTILHPYMGLRWGSVKRDLDINSISNAIGALDTELFTVAETVFIGSFSREKSDFNGVGPLAGMDISYYLGGGFGLVGHFDSALLIGDINSSDNVTIPYFANEEVEGLTLPDVSISGSGILGFSTKSDNARVVPVVDGKLGFDYTFVFNNAANSDITIEAGWHAAHYFNAIDRTPLIPTVTPNIIFITPIPIFIYHFSLIPGRTTVSHFTSDFADNGPYVSIQLHV